MFQVDFSEIGAVDASLHDRDRLFFSRQIRHFLTVFEGVEWGAAWNFFCRDARFCMRICVKWALIIMDSARDRNFFFKNLISDDFFRDFIRFSRRGSTRNTPLSGHVTRQPSRSEPPDQLLQARQTIAKKISSKQKTQKCNLLPQIRTNASESRPR